MSQVYYKGKRYEKKYDLDLALDRGGAKGFAHLVVIQALIGKEGNPGINSLFLRFCKYYTLKKAYE